MNPRIDRHHACTQAKSSHDCMQVAAAAAAAAAAVSGNGRNQLIGLTVNGVYLYSTRSG